MNRGVYPLLAAQFITAFADNAVLFAVIAMVLKAATVRQWYVPALQASFLAAFVLLAPWVGPFADGRPKAVVLIIGNALKAVGAALLVFGIEPLLAYGLVGAGAAVYSPAKYGILPELVGHDQLVQANGWMEGSTIFAIISGTVVGGQVSDWSVRGALIMVFGLYLLSMAVSLLVPRIPAERPSPRAALPHFLGLFRELFVLGRARATMLATSLFWAAAAVLRLLLVAWAPAVLHLKESGQIADLTLFLALGLVLGALLVPRLIPIEALRRTRFAAFVMGLCIVALSQAGALDGARVALFAVGVTGGLFIVPIDAAIQEIGYQTIGSGNVVAVQNFFENVAMLLSVGLYTVAVAEHTRPVESVLGLGVAVLAATLLFSWRLPPAPPGPALRPADGKGPDDA